MRKDVEFKDSNGVTLRGWHYLPEGRAGRFPTVVMAHGFSATRDLFLDRYAELFAEAGIASVLYDHRNFGASDGEPRQEIDPWQQIAGYRDAITFAETLPATDPARIGVFGSSYSGGHVLVVAAIDRRVKCVVAQVPLIDGPLNAARLIPAPNWKAMRESFDADRRSRAAGQPPARLPVVAPPGQPCALPTEDSYEFFVTVGGQKAKSWVNEVTLRSVEAFTEYRPGAYIDKISPTPLMLVVAGADHLTMADIALEAFERAREPKRLVLLPGGHFDAYIRDFAVAGGSARDWFREHLRAL
jgi:fermentation-respiration switch protein FrsA (DUF1100 family)